MIILCGLIVMYVQDTDKWELYKTTSKPLCTAGFHNDSIPCVTPVHYTYANEVPDHSSV